MLFVTLNERAWSNVENTLTADMSLIAKYLRTWRLKLSMAKTTATAFHLNTKEANRQLTITLDGTPLSYNATPTYLGVKLDRPADLQGASQVHKSKSVLKKQPPSPSRRLKVGCLCYHSSY